MATKYLGKVTSESEQRQFGCIILSTNERITWSRWVNAFGRVQPQDVGKKVFDVDSVLQMESQGQKAEREALEAQSEFFAEDDNAVIEITRLPVDSFYKWRVTVYSRNARPQCYVNANLNAAVVRLLGELK